MRRQQSGFTLIELIAVIVILGALAVVALPRFINLQDEARVAATQGVAGSAGSAAAVNLAGALAGDGASTDVRGCGDVGPLIEGGVPADYQIPGTNTAAVSGTGDAFTCEVVNVAGGPTQATATFQAYEVPSAP